MLPDSELINQNCTLDVKGAYIGSKYVEGKGEPLRLFGFPLSAYNCIIFFLNRLNAFKYKALKMHYKGISTLSAVWKKRGESLMRE